MLFGEMDVPKRVENTRLSAPVFSTFDFHCPTNSSAVSGSRICLEHASVFGVLDVSS